MKKIVVILFAILTIAMNMKALEPVRIGLNYPNPSGSLKVRLIDISTIDPNTNDHLIVAERTITDVTANSSGVVSLVVGENDPDWGDLSASYSTNPSIVLRVLDNSDNFLKQSVFRDLVATQSSTGNGGVLDDGFNSTNGLTTSGETNDDFLFGAVQIFYTPPTTSFMAAGDDTKFFFKNNLSAIRAGAVTSDVWDVANLGEYSSGFGYNTEASGEAAFAAGYYSTATGDNSTAFGNYSTSNGDNSFAIGVGTYAASFGEVAIGTYNTIPAESDATAFDIGDRAFVVGNGFDGEGIIRSDAMVVYKSGDTEINGDLTVENTLYADGITYPSDDGNEGQILTYDSEGSELVWSDPAPTLYFDENSFNGDGSSETPYSISLNTDGTLTGDPFSVEGSLGVDLTAANTWTGNTTFGADLSLTKTGMTGNGNQALYTDDNGLVTAGSGETVQNAAGIYAGTAAWSGTSITISDGAVDANSIITITYVGSGGGAGYSFRVNNIATGLFDVLLDGQGPTSGTIHYMIINQ